MMANNEPNNEPILRLKEEERNKLNRKKRNNNSGDVMKELNKKRKLQDMPIISGSLKYYVSNQEDKMEFMNKIDKAKLCIGDKISGVSNYEVLNKVLDCFLKENGHATEETNENQQTEKTSKSICIVKRMAQKRTCLCAHNLH